MKTTYPRHQEIEINKERSEDANIPSRRQFVAWTTLTGTAALTGLACSRRQQSTAMKARQGANSQLAPVNSDQTNESQNWHPFPYVEAEGTPEEIGIAVGRATAQKIRTTIDRLRENFEEYRQFALADRAQRLDPWLNAVNHHHPEVLAELRGLAQGAELPFEDLLIWNLQPELGALRDLRNDAGCSTLQVNQGSRLIFAHNEDGDAAYRDQLVLLHLRPQGHPAVTCLAYPGLIPGQVPAATSSGLFFSTNFISTREVRPGIPRYVLGRAILACRSVADVISLATKADRAYAYTLHVGSHRERRLLCLELGPRTHQIEERQGLLIHTNHFVLPGTKELPQRSGNRTGSSGSRLEILQGATANLANPEELNEERLVNLLSSHEAVRQPYSPCRHPTESYNAQTLALAAFDLTVGSFVLYEGNPCEGRRRVIDVIS